MCFAPQRRAIFGHHTFKKWSEPVSFLTFWLPNVLRATAACHFWTSELPKWLRQWGVLCIFTCKCASRHSGVQFFNIATSKMAPRMWCFVHFHLQMCFAPQRRAIYQHRNFQNGSANVVFCAFSLANVLRATAACNFSTSQLPKWLRECGVLRILTCKCASRHSGVQFFNIATSKMAPTMRCFAHFDLQMCFAPQRRTIFHLSARTATSAPAALARLLFEHQEPRIIEKTQRFATSLTFFAHVPSFYWLYTRVDLLSADWTSLLCLTPPLCFSTLHIVGS